MNEGVSTELLAYVATMRRFVLPINPMVIYRRFGLEGARWWVEYRRQLGM